MIALPIALMLLSGCTYYETAPGHYVAAPYVVAPPPAAVGAFDRSWTAAVGAFDDQGVRGSYPKTARQGSCAGRGMPST